MDLDLRISTIFRPQSKPEYAISMDLDASSSFKAKAWLGNSVIRVEHTTPQGSKNPNNRVLGPSTMNTIAFGPQDPIIWVLGPLGTIGPTVWGFSAGGLGFDVSPKLEGGLRVLKAWGSGPRKQDSGLEA